MNNSLVLFSACAILIFSLIGCGGGNGSSSNAGDKPTTSSSLPNSSPPSSSRLVSLTINPLGELGLETGDNICFSVKSYNNYSESTYSKAICSQVKNANSLTLSWNKVIGNVNGYYIYFGSSKNNATNFLADVIES